MNSTSNTNRTSTADTSKQASHTPGPWKIGRGADGYPIIHTAPDTFSPSGQGVAHVCKRAMCQDHESNARLIASAPDLLAALKEVNRGDQFSDATILVERAGHPELAKALRRYRDNALAAIAKAEGRS